MEEHDIEFRCEAQNAITLPDCEQRKLLEEYGTIHTDTNDNNLRALIYNDGDTSEVLLSAFVQNDAQRLHDTYGSISDCWKRLNHEQRRLVIFSRILFDHGGLRAIPANPDEFVSFFINYCCYNRYENLVAQRLDELYETDRDIEDIDFVEKLVFAQQAVDKIGFIIREPIPEPFAIKSCEVED